VAADNRLVGGSSTTQSNANRDFPVNWKYPRIGRDAQSLRGLCFGMTQLQQGFTGGMGSDRHFAWQQSSGPNVRFGSEADTTRSVRDVRFTPESCRGHRRPTRQLRAKSRHQLNYSITSSARASNDGGTVRPRACAVLRLITSSYLVGACTGRSAGFSPLRMRSTYRAALRNCSSTSDP
jgi:hypothetical protein